MKINSQTSDQIDSKVYWKVNNQVYRQVYNQINVQVIILLWFRIFTTRGSCSLSLGEACGPTIIHQTSSENYGMSSLMLERRGIPINIHKITIDSLNLSCCDAIQLDVERAEELVLSGAKETISRFKPIISVETNNSKVQTLFKDYNYVMSKIVCPDTIYTPVIE